MITRPLNSAVSFRTIDLEISSTKCELQLMKQKLSGLNNAILAREKKLNRLQADLAMQGSSLRSLRAHV